MIYKRQITRKIKHAWCLRWYNCDCRRFFTLIKSIRQTRKMIDTIHPMNIIYLCVALPLSLSPLGGCLVAMVMDKDNTVFICYSFFCLNESTGFFPNRLESDQSSITKNEGEHIEGGGRNTHQQQQQPNSDETTKWKCFHNSVKHGHMKTNWLWVIECKKSVHSFGMNELMALSVTVTQNVVCLVWMLSYSSSLLVALFDYV